MGQVLVRYKVKPDQADENERLVKRVFAELKQLAPPGIRYGTLRLTDGVSLRDSRPIRYCVLNLCGNIFHGSIPRRLRRERSRCLDTPLLTAGFFTGE